MKRKEVMQNFTTPLYLACHKEHSKLKYIYFKDDYAFACDAKILIKQSLCYHNIEGVKYLNGNCLLAEDYKKILKFKRVVAKEKCIVCFDKDDNKTVFAYGKETPFDFDFVINRWKECECGNIFANSILLENAAKCLYNYNSNKYRPCKYTFLIDENINAVKIECSEKDFENQFAIVMTLSN